MKERAADARFYTRAQLPVDHQSNRWRPDSCERSENEILHFAYAPSRLLFRLAILMDYWRFYSLFRANCYLCFGIEPSKALINRVKLVNVGRHVGQFINLYLNFSSQCVGWKQK